LEEEYIEQVFIFTMNIEVAIMGGRDGVEGAITYRAIYSLPYYEAKNGCMALL
jgi:hypothetical protein